MLFAITPKSFRTLRAGTSNSGIHSSEKRFIASCFHKHLAFLFSFIESI